MGMAIKPIDVSIYCLHIMNCTLSQLLRCQRIIKYTPKAVCDLCQINIRRCTLNGMSRVCSEPSQTDEAPSPADISPCGLRISAIQSKGWPAQTDVPHGGLHMGPWQLSSNPAHPDGLCSCPLCLNQTVVKIASRVDPDSLYILPIHPCFSYLGNAETLKPAPKTTTCKYTNHKHLHLKTLNIIFILYLQQS